MSVIIFDFWGTLVEQGTWSPIKQVRNILGIKLPFAEFVVRMEKVIMTKRQDTLREAFEELCKEFSIKPSESILESLIGLWNKYWVLAAPYDGVEEMIKNLKNKGHTIVLMANSDCFSIPNVIAKYPFFDQCDNHFLSCDVGTIKSDPRFLDLITSTLNVEPKDCIVVGDSLKSDIEPALDKGMKAILVDRRNTRNFEPKVQSVIEVEKVLSI